MSMENVTPRAVAAARALRALDQAALAALLSKETERSWSRQMVCNLETGKRRVDSETLVALAKILDVPAGFLLYGLEAQMGYSTLIAPDLHVLTAAV